MDLPDVVTHSEVAQLVQRYYRENPANHTSLEITSYEIRTAGDRPQGLLSKHYFLEVIVKLKSENEEDSTSLKYFVKKAPAEVASLMNYIDVIRVFEKEYKLFRQLIPRLQNVNSKFGKFAPDCYLAERNLIILEDLAHQGFRIGSMRDQLLDYSHLLCAVKTLAKMHSASIVLETKANKTLTSLFPNCLEENSFPADSDNIRNHVLQVGVAAICDLIRLLPKYSSSSQLPFILDSYHEKFRQMHVFCRPSERFRNVMLHGDLWTNNLMFRYDSSNSPIDSKIVDFQLSRYGPPLHDIMTVLTTTTTSAFRQTHMNALLENYYHFLDDFLTAHNMDVDDVFSKMEFKECINYFRIFGLLFSCHISHETLLPAEITGDLYTNSDLFEEFQYRDHSKLCQKAFETDSIYRERMTDVLTDLIDNFILIDT